MSCASQSNDLIRVCSSLSYDLGIGGLTYVRVSCVPQYVLVSSGLRYVLASSVLQYVF